MKDRPQELIAYRLGNHSRLRLGAASANRKWMDETDKRFSNRCLPMLIANQAGWTILNGSAFRAKWVGKGDMNGVVIETAGDTSCVASSHFGYGILTFTLPFLFRTPPGVSLLFRGPANAPKDAIAPLEGLVETDWAVSTATMNWQFTRAHTWVEFAVDEPICMLVPQQFELLQELYPRLLDIAEDVETNRAHLTWSESRRTFNDNLRSGNQETMKLAWQRHYFRGTSPASEAEVAESHCIRLGIREFVPSAIVLKQADAASITSPKKSSKESPCGTAENVGCATSSEARSIDGKSVQFDVRNLSPAERLLNDLVMIDDFIPYAEARELIDVYRRRGSTGRGDNGLPIQQIAESEPAAFEIARSAVARIITLVEAHFHERVWCDLALFSAITGTFSHTLHADNSLVCCPRHGVNAEQLVHLNCQCDDIQVLPNHTPWRSYTGLLYLDNDHVGGDIIFGEGPNAFGRLYRKEITVRSGLLVLTPSNEFYYHRTTPVSQGTRYSMNCWFTSDKTRKTF